MRYKCARGAVPPLGQSWHGPASRTDVSRQSCLRPATLGSHGTVPHKNRMRHRGRGRG